MSCSGEIVQDGWFDISLNLRGINFAGDKGTIRVFEWRNNSYKDITRNLDLHKGIITARTNKLSTLVIMNEQLHPKTIDRGHEATTKMTTKK